MRRVLLSAGLVLALLATLVVGGAAAAKKGDPFIGTWHQRDSGTSNIFYFISEPIGGVFPVLYFDDYTGVVCPDHGPMLWTGFAQKVDSATLTGSFGTYWCLQGSSGGPAENPFALPERFPWDLAYDAATDTITGGIGLCIGTRQPLIKTVAKAQMEIAKGKYPPPDTDPRCEEDR
jgi:hypothetical protein